MAPDVIEPSMAFDVIVCYLSCIHYLRLICSCLVPYLRVNQSAPLILALPLM